MKTFLAFLKTFLSFLRRRLLVPFLISLFTLIIGYAIQQIALTKARPVLKKEVIKTDLTGLTPDIKRQITLVPINYSLQNNSRAPAQNVTIFIKSDSILSIADLKFAQDSEDHQFGTPDVHEFKVNVPIIRPGGFVSFQIITAANNNITFSERSDNALFETQKGASLDAQAEKNVLVEWGVGAFILLVWLPILSMLIYVFWRAGKTWQEIEASTSQPEFRNRLIIFIIALYIYDDLILASFGPIGMWLPLPRINFAELVYAFIFYLLVTRYKLVENWISAMIEKQKREK